MEKDSYPRFLRSDLYNSLIASAWGLMKLRNNILPQVSWTLAATEPYLDLPATRKITKMEDYIFHFSFAADDGTGCRMDLQSCGDCHWIRFYLAIYRSAYKGLHHSYAVWIRCVHVLRSELTQIPYSRVCRVAVGAWDFVCKILGELQTGYCVISQINKRPLALPWPRQNAEPVWLSTKFWGFLSFWDWYYNIIMKNKM